MKSVNKEELDNGFVLLAGIVAKLLSDKYTKTTIKKIVETTKDTPYSKGEYAEAVFAAIEIFLDDE